jgi:hypothetical protein
MKGGSVYIARFDGLLPLDLPLSLAVAPEVLNGIPDSIEISVQCSDDALHGIDARVRGIVPVFQQGR